ncbi:MAG TPA: Ig-like domain-containing protein, partial [Paludibacter sp.]
MGKWIHTLNKTNIGTKSIFIVVFSILVSFIDVSAQQGNAAVPFSTDTTQLTIWNGKTYIPFFIKGVNMGIAKPGTQPGDLEATREQYARWFDQIKQAGFNCIRIYTLHYPHFYEELEKYNLNNPQHPLFFFQGIWLNEELNGYLHDLYQMSDTFRVEIQENINCVHGNGVIGPRFGKAFGTYSANVSKWNLGYIIGRETAPYEVLTTNKNHPQLSSYSGNHFAISEVPATEVWWTRQLDFAVNYEREHYGTERPVSVSSWPTLDPIHHPAEPNRDEDTASVDLSKIKIIDAPAGLFISYHAYPYYPDFVSNDTTYKKYSDSFGPNSYLGYLKDLKKHYSKFPLIIAEYGVPSSWGVAHYASSGMNHGGFDEAGQGETDIRILNTIKAANGGGGIQFAWLDEWFKRTWITDPFDFLNRYLWHNITAAEQNFGLVKFTKKETYIPWKTFGSTDDITNVKALANYDFFQMEIGLKSPMDILGECWIAFDTYDSTLGESTLPTGIKIPNRSEFALHITQHSAELFVTEAYDLFGIYHKELSDNQKLQSTATDGAPWNIVRWKNNSGAADVQYIGDLKLNRSFQPVSSKDAVTISDTKINVRIPWSLLQVVDPSQMRVFHDNKATADTTETRVSDGIAVNILYKSKLYTPDNRFVWPMWNVVKDSDVVEQLKTSYWTMYNQLTNFNSPAIAYPDTFDLSNVIYPYSIQAIDGLLKNDFDPDGSTVSAVLSQAPKNGFVELNPDGSFTYSPKNGFIGTDVFSYCIFDGQSLSKANTVSLLVNNPNSVESVIAKSDLIKLYPNPAKDFAVIESEIPISTLRIFDYQGKLLAQKL